jgi:hypothetical protein
MIAGKLAGFNSCFRLHGRVMIGGKFAGFDPCSGFHDSLLLEDD